MLRAYSRGRSCVSIKNTACPHSYLAMLCGVGGGQIIDVSFQMGNCVGE